MKVRKFFAPSSREALRLVREALGADAVVLSNRVVDGGVELVALTEETLTDMVDEHPMLSDDVTLPLSVDQRYEPYLTPSVPAPVASPASSRYEPLQVKRSNFPLEPLSPSSSPSSQAASEPAHWRNGWGEATSSGEARAAQSAAAPSRNGPLRRSSVPPVRPVPPPPPRDRTIAPPGVLAAAKIGDDGASALAYVHRATHTAQMNQRRAAAAAQAAAAADAAAKAALSAKKQAVQSRSAPIIQAGLAAPRTAMPSSAPYNNGLSMYNSQDDVGDEKSSAASYYATRDDEETEEHDVVWTPSNLVSKPVQPRVAEASSSQHDLMSNEAFAPAPAPVRAEMPAFEAPRASLEQAYFGAEVALPEPSSFVDETPTEDDAAFETEAAHDDGASFADEATEAPLMAAPAAEAFEAPPARSVFSRVFARPSFRERAGVAESRVPGLVRPEKLHDEASVLGLVRAEREDQASVPGLMRPERQNGDGGHGLTPSAATARGLGSAGNIIMRPAVMPEEHMLARQTALPVQSQETRLMADSQDTRNDMRDAERSMSSSAQYGAFAAESFPKPVATNAAPASPGEQAVTTDSAEKTADVAALREPSATPSFGASLYSSQTRVKAGASVQTVPMSLPFLGLQPVAPVVSAPTDAKLGDVAAAEAVAADAAGPAPVVATSDASTPATAAVSADASSLAADASKTSFAATDVPALDLAAASLAEERSDASVRADAASTAKPAADDANPRKVAGQVLTEMRTLCGTLGEQLEALDSHERERRDPTRIAVTRMLLACGFSAQLVRLLLAKMPAVGDAEQGLAWVKATFERNLPVLDNEDALMERGGVFALMGPTGVGKTTTTAKLAARAVMRHGADRVALLTTDSYRIGAHEQLRIYGRILGVAVHAVKDAADLTLVLSELRNKHMVLIDTIGMSQRDRAVSEQVAMLRGTHLPVKRLLLLNATSHGDTLNEVVRAYGARGEQGDQAGLSGCIITKVDESNGIGAALDTVMRHRLPVHYVSNGQKVPEDLRVAQRGFLIDKAFSERHRASPFQVDEEDIALMFGGDAHGSATASASKSGEVHYG